jgi:sugar-specific transcriptional regulator TrmB
MATLRDLGLSEYESRAYRALLETGPTTAKELSRASDVPMGRIYDVLGGLESDNLVRTQTASRPKKYAAVEPDTALDRLLSDKKRELEEQKDQYEEIVDALSEDLETAEPVDEPFWTAALGPEEATDLLVERLATAEERIVLVADTPAAGFDIDDLGRRIVTEMERALNRGVAISLLIRPELLGVLPEDVGNLFRERLQGHDAFSVRTSGDVTGTFELIDHAEVCIEVSHPLNPGQPFALINLKDTEVASGIEEAFHDRWAEGDPLEL